VAAILRYLYLKTAKMQHKSVKKSILQHLKTNGEECPGRSSEDENLFYYYEKEL